MQQKRGKLMALLIVALLAITACGGDTATTTTEEQPTTSTEEPSATSTSQQEATTSTEEAEPLEPLTVATAGTNPTLSGTIALGVTAGIFEDVGLDIELNLAAGRGQAVNDMVAGDADIIESNIGNAGNLEIQGLDVQSIWAGSGGTYGFMFWTNIDGPSTVEEFQSAAAEGCTMGVTTPGSTGYGFSKLFLNALDVDCELIEFGEPEQIAGALVAGRIDAYASPLESTMNAALEAGEVQILIDTADPEVVEQLDIPLYTGRVLMGLEENLEAKRESVVAFITGMRRAAELYETGDVEEIADLLLTLDAYQTDYPGEEGRADLVAAIESSRPNVNWNDGYITEEDWNNGIAAAVEAETPDFDPDDPARSYDELVDMSFYDESES